MTPLPRRSTYENNISFPSDRRLQTTFLISIGLVTGSAGLILAASLSRIFPAAFSPLVAAATLFFVDHRRRKLLSTLTANLLGLAALAAAFNNFSDSNLERLTAGTDFLVFLTWIVLGMQKAPRQYWWLAALSVLQITTAGVLTASVGFGTALFLMSLLMIWTLSVFSLYRTALWHNQQTATLGVAGAGEPRVRAPWRRRALKFLRGFLGLAPRSTSVVRQNPGTVGVIVRHGLDRDPAEFWTGWRFGLSVLGSWIISILVGLFVFAVFPAHLGLGRTWARERRVRRRCRNQHHWFLRQRAARPDRLTSAKQSAGIHVSCS
ncbi:MAG UNVERIFIED_CONTAM: hypothetical protein LVR18_51985 [Planctomycetaceae bacterium]